MPLEWMPTAAAAEAARPARPCFLSVELDSAVWVFKVVDGDEGRADASVVVVVVCDGTAESVV